MPDQKKKELRMKVRYVLAAIVPVWIVGGAFLALQAPAIVAHPEESVTDAEQETAYRLSRDTLDEFLAKDRKYAAMGFGTGRESLDEGFSLGQEEDHWVQLLGAVSYADNEIFVEGTNGVEYDAMARALSRYGFSIAGYLPDDTVFMARCPESEEFFDLWTTCKAMEREPEIVKAAPAAETV